MGQPHGRELPERRGHRPRDGFELPGRLHLQGHCGLGVPDGSPPVTLTATPARGYKFDHWETGACSGNGDCSVSVNGLMKTRAVFVELPAALHRRARPGRQGASGDVTVSASTLETLDLTAAGTTRAPRRRPDASRPGRQPRRRHADGEAPVPKSVKAGAATVRVTLHAPEFAKTFVENRAIRLPKL